MTIGQGNLLGTLRDRYSDPLLTVLTVLLVFEMFVVAPLQASGIEIFQALGVFAAGNVFPHLFSAEGLHAADPHFAAAPAFGHALRGFQSVEIIGVHPAVTDRETFPQWGI